MIVFIFGVLHFATRRVMNAVCCPIVHQIRSPRPVIESVIARDGVRSSRILC